jgi:hypothetical protein
LCYGGEIGARENPRKNADPADEGEEFEKAHYAAELSAAVAVSCLTLRSILSSSAVDYDLEAI